MAGDDGVLHDHERSDLWERWLPRDRRRTLRHAARRGARVDDPLEAALVVDHAKAELRTLRRTRWFGGLSLLAVVVPLIPFGAPDPSIGMVVVGAWATAVVSAVASWRRRSAAIRRNAGHADVDGLRRLARERRAERLGAR